MEVREVLGPGKPITSVAVKVVRRASSDQQYSECTEGGNVFQRALQDPQSDLTIVCACMSCEQSDQITVLLLQFNSVRLLKHTSKTCFTFNQACFGENLLSLFCGSSTGAICEWLWDERGAEQVLQLVKVHPTAHLYPSIFCGFFPRAGQFVSVDRGGVILANGFLR